MDSNPGRAASAIKAIRASPGRAGGNVDLYDISQAFTYRARIEMRSLLSTVASASDGSVDSAVRKLSLSSEPQTKSSHTDVTRNCVLYSCYFLIRRPFPGLVCTNRIHTVRVR